MTTDLVDSLVADRVLVFGALPPAGRDLDLLARPAEEVALANGLPEHGFTRRGRAWARLRDCTADVVDLVPAAKWSLPDPELEALFRDAVPIENLQHLVSPAPHHALLILARRLAAGTALDDKRRQRVQALLDRDPGCFEAARRRADAWGVRRDLTALEARLAGKAGRGSRLRRLPSRPRRGTLVCFSGLDGSGKSSQATALRDTLDRLGHDAVIEWTSVAQHPPVLHAITGAVGFVARLRQRGSAPEAARESVGAASGKALRERSGLVTFAWATVVALTNGLTHFRRINRHLWRGRTVICDRYELDSKVHMRYAYGEQRRFSFQAALIQLLSPRPDRAYLLDVPGEEATRRKQDYSVEDNQLRARLYREEYPRLGVKRMDGTRPRETICTEIAEDVLFLLTGA